MPIALTAIVPNHLMLVSAKHLMSRCIDQTKFFLFCMCDLSGRIVLKAGNSYHTCPTSSYWKKIRGVGFGWPYSMYGCCGFGEASTAIEEGDQTLHPNKGGQPRGPGGWNYIRLTLPIPAHVRIYA